MRNIEIPIKICKKYINKLNTRRTNLFTGIEPIFFDEQTKISKEYLVTIKEIELINLKKELRSKRC